MILNAPTAEKRLTVDIKGTIEAYNGHIFASMIWIQRKLNLADIINKSVVNDYLVQAMHNWTISFEIEK